MGTVALNATASPTPALQITGLYGMPSWGRPWEGTAVPLAVEEKGTVRIPLANLVERTVRLEVPEGVMELLTASIRHVGLVHPLYVAKAEGATYEVLDGNLRLRALRRIDPEGTLTVPCVVVQADEKRRVLLQHASAIQHRPSSFELFYALYRRVRERMDERAFAEALKSFLRYSDNQQEISDPLVHASVLVISRIIGAHGLTPYEAYRQFRFYQRIPPRAKALFEEGKLALVFARILASKKVGLLPEEVVDRLIDTALTLEPTPYGVAKFRKLLRAELEAHLGGYEVGKLASALRKRYSPEVLKELAQAIAQEVGDS